MKSRRQHLDHSCHPFPFSQHMLDWMQHLMSPSVFNMLCDRIKKIHSKYPVACLTLLLTLVKECELNLVQLGTVVSLVIPISDKQHSSFDHVSHKCSIMKHVFEIIVQLEMQTTALSADSTKPSTFTDIFAVIPINSLPIEQVMQLCQSFLDKLKRGMPSPLSSLWLERESLLSVLRT